MAIVADATTRLQGAACLAIQPCLAEASSPRMLAFASRQLRPSPGDRACLRVASLPPLPKRHSFLARADAESERRGEAPGTRDSPESSLGLLVIDEERSPSDGGASLRPGGGISDSDEEVSSLMEGMTWAELCNEFECVSSPSIEKTARLLARDIHDMKEEARNLSEFATKVKFKDPLWSFEGKDKYRRPSWIWNALEQPRVSMLSMELLSTSVLLIRWRLRGVFRLPAASLLGGALDLIVTSTFTLNQISGQVIEHRDEWDLRSCSPPAVLLFYTSRLAWSAVQRSKDLASLASKLNSLVEKGKGSNDGSYVYPDPSGDPRKFFIQDDPNREMYQFAFGVALMYLVVQFLKNVL